MISAFRRVVSKDYATQRIQENVGICLKQISSKEILDGVLVEAEIATTNTQVDHKLGREPQGFVIVDRQPVASGTEGHILRVSWDDLKLILKTTGTGTIPVKLWVF